MFTSRATQLQDVSWAQWKRCRIEASCFLLLGRIGLPRPNDALPANLCDRGLEGGISLDLPRHRHLPFATWRVRTGRAVRTCLFPPSELVMQQNL